MNARCCTIALTLTSILVTKAKLWFFDLFCVFHRIYASFLYQYFHRRERNVIYQWFFSIEIKNRAFISSTWLIQLSKNLTFDGPRIEEFFLCVVYQIKKNQIKKWCDKWAQKTRDSNGNIRNSIIFVYAICYVIRSVVIIRAGVFLSLHFCWSPLQLMFRMHNTM